MKSAPLISLENVSVALGGRMVLRDLTWRLAAGQHWLVRGPNGCGKTTLLKLLRGELAPHPDHGVRRYLHDGRITESAALVRTRFAYVSPEQQERYLQLEWDRDAWEVLLTGFHGTDYLYQPVSAQQRRAARQLAAELDLGELLPRNIQTLSQGELRRVLVARALVGRPVLLLLDEFCDGLDTRTRRRMVGWVDALARRGTQIVLTTHRREEWFPSLTHVLELERGRIKRQGPMTGWKAIGESGGGGSSIAPKHPGENFPNHISRFEPLNPTVAPLTPSLPLNRSAEHCSAGADEHPKAGQCSALRSGSRAQIAEVGGPWILSPRPKRGEGARRAGEGCSDNPQQGAVHGKAAAQPSAGDDFFRLIQPSPRRAGSRQSARPFLFLLSEVDVYRDRVRILRNLNWRMNAGENWAVLGPNGAGKSTFLKLLQGELHPALGGGVRRFNETRRHTLWEIRRRVGFVSMDFQMRFQEELTGADAVATGYFGGHVLHDSLTRPQRARVNELIELFELGEHARRPVGAISYGQLRRVLIARALVHAPEVLILDEPFDGLEPEIREVLRGHLNRLAGLGVSLLMVTHHPGDLPACVTHGLVLESGTLAISGRLRARKPAAL